MKAYKIELALQAAKDLEAVRRADRTLYRRFLSALESISLDPHQGKTLHGELRGLTSYRFGSYRILYEISDRRLLVLIIDLGHRKAIYR